jgi:putative DNA primase/helicase
MTFAADVGFASVVLRPLGVQTCVGFHLYGISRIGKSTATMLALTVTGSSVLPYDKSRAGIEDQCHIHSDTLLVMDEIKQAKAADFARDILRIGNGRSKILHRKYLTWLLTYLTNGEHSVPEFLARNNLPPLDEGEQVRLISLPAEIGPLGSFDTIHGFASAKEFADHIGILAQENKGAVILEFLEFFTKDYDGCVARLREKRAKFAEIEKRKYPELLRAPAWVGGILDHFAIMAAAGELATELGCTGWPAGWATLAASKEFALWYETEYKGSTRIEDGALQVFDWIDKNKNRVEFEIERGRTICWVAVDDFKKACAPFDHQAVARELRRQGKLTSEKDGHLTRRKRNGPVGPCDRPHFFCVIVTGDIGDSMDTGAKSTSQPPLMRTEPNKVEDLAGDTGDKETIQ